MKKSTFLLGAGLGAIMLVAATSGANAQSWADNTTVSGRMYYDVTGITRKVDGVTSDAAGLGAAGTNGTGFDIKRFYVGIDHKFTDLISTNITTDFQYSSGVSATEVYLKKAYIDFNFDPRVDLKVGSNDMPWIPYAENIYGNRYVEKTLIDRMGFGTSADWGLHAGGNFGAPADDLTVSYAVSAINGNGYKNPSRTKAMDFEGRVSAVVYGQYNFALGGYTGELGQQTISVPTPQKASRLDALAAWVGDQGRVGVEYFSANDYSSALVKATTPDKADGYSAFGTYRFNHDWSTFARIDNVKPTKLLTPTKTDKYYNLGVTYSAFKNVDFSLTAKHEEVTASTGTPIVAHKTTNDEVGVFAQFRY